MMKDDELYDGFTPGQAREYRKEAAEKWGEDEVRASEDRVRRMGPEKWKQVKENSDRIMRELAQLINTDPGSPEVQALIDQWKQHLENFYAVSEERLRGLGEMYVADERFRATYDRYAPGLADFKNKAIQIYCDRGMKVD